MAIATTPSTMFNELKAQLAEIDKQIKHVKNIISLDYPPEQRPKLDAIYYTLTNASDGKPVLLDLIVSRSQIVAAMANLKAAEMNTRTR